MDAEDEDNYNFHLLECRPLYNEWDMMNSWTNSL